MTHHDLSTVDPQDEARAPLPTVGAMLTVTTATDATATVVVERAIDGHVTGTLSGGDPPTPGSATIRWFEPAEATLQAAAVVAPCDDETRVHLRLTTPWCDTHG